MIDTLNSRSRGPGASPDWEHGTVFLDKTLYSNSASHHVPIGTCNAG